VQLLPEAIERVGHVEVGEHVAVGEVDERLARLLLGAEQHKEEHRVQHAARRVGPRARREEVDGVRPVRLELGGVGDDAVVLEQVLGLGRPELVAAPAVEGDVAEQPDVRRVDGELDDVHRPPELAPLLVV